MSTPSFEAAVSAAQQEEPEVATIKQSFAEPLKQLATLKKQWATQHPQFHDRFLRVQQRAQLAISAGVTVELVSRLLNPMVRELVGGGDSLPPGLLHTIGPQIESGIEAMSRFSLRDVPARGQWLTWPHIPGRVRDNIHAAEERLSGLEDIVKDGGQLQQMIEQVAERKAGSKAVTS
jgi:hypothetical protein